MLVISKNKPYFVGDVAGLTLESSSGTAYQIYGMMDANRAERIPLSRAGSKAQAEQAMIDLQKQLEDLYLTKKSFLVHFSDQSSETLGISVEVIGKEVKRKC